MSQGSIQPSTTKGFMGPEVFGDRLHPFEKLLNMLSHVPLISDLAYAIVRAFGAEKDAEILVPRITILLLAVLIPLIMIALRALVLAILNIARFNTKGSGANARYATFFEVFRQYTIPSWFSTTVFGISISLSFVLPFYLFSASKIVTYLAIPAVLIGIYVVRLFKGPMKAIRKRVQPYPLGFFQNFLKIYLTGGWRLSFIRGDVKEQRQNHVLVIGPPGARKTTAYFIPGLLEDAHNNCSAVVVEAKNEDQENMYEYIAPTWTSQKKRVILFDPFGNGDSVSFNPLLNLDPEFDDYHTREVIDRTIDAIIKTYEKEKGTPSGEAYFHQDQEVSLLRGLMYISLRKPKGQRNMSAIYEVLNGTVDSVVSYIRGTINLSTTSDELAKRIWKELAWFMDDDNISKRDRGLMLRGTAGKLQVFSNPRVKSKVINNELDLDSVFQTPTLLCIKAATNDPGASTIASMIIRLLMMKVPEKLSHGAGKEFKLWFYLDELPALAIPKFEEFMRTARSSGTGVIAGIQDLSDLADVFRPKLGMASIHGLAGNFKTQILLPGLQPETAKYYADSFGKREIKARRTYRDTKHLLDFSYQSERSEAPLTTQDNIKNMIDHQAIIVDRTTRPFLITTEPFYQSRRYMGMIKKHKTSQIELHRLKAEPVTYESPTISEYQLTDKKKVSKDVGAMLARDALRDGGEFVPPSDISMNSDSISQLSAESETSAVIGALHDKAGVLHNNDGSM